MKIYLIEKSAGKKLTNLGAKIKLEKLNSLLNSENSILLQEVSGGQQKDFRIRKVYTDEEKTQSRYVLSSEIGKAGFDTFIPRLKTAENKDKFGNLKDLLDFLEKEWGIMRSDWIIV